MLSNVHHIFLYTIRAIQVANSNHRFDELKSNLPLATDSFPQDPEIQGPKRHSLVRHPLSWTLKHQTRQFSRWNGAVIDRLHRHVVGVLTTAANEELLPGMVVPTEALDLFNDIGSHLKLQHQ